MSHPPLNVTLLLDKTFVARVEHYPRLGSTNDRAREAAAEGGDLPLLIVADEQTAGRGRGMNRWWTGPGSLAFSLLMDVEDLRIDRPRAPLVALAAAVAVVEAVVPLLESHVVGVHWPNDVFVDGRKLAGILVETLSPRLYVIGVGLNTNNSLADAPQDLRSRVATLRDLAGQPQNQTVILLAILENLARLLVRLGATPERVAARADALCLQKGRQLVLDTGRGLLEGRCAGIAGDGALLLTTSDGLRAVSNGVIRET